MHSSNHGLQSRIASAALVLMLATIWLLMRGYHGLLGDGQLYAFQALARIHPQLANDLYLQNTSQDRFTIFSPAYAWFIGILGLEQAARFLTLVFTAWLLVAAWCAARILTSRDGGYLAVASLLIIAGSYGGSGVFTFAEPFLTARLPAEALIVTSIACYLRGLKVLAMAMAAAALLIHPLIALPGLLLLMCLYVPTYASVIAAIACAITGLLIAGAATRFPWVSDLFPVMDSAWLNVVEERSQFLFLQLWSFRDWGLNARPFFYLAFTALAVQDVRIRRLCVAAATVGATGLAVALIASVLGPVAILVQGQAWRWVWIAVFVSALLLPATILDIWRDKSCGPLCAVLLLAGLTLSAIDGTACVSLAMIFWLMRSNITARVGAYFRWIFFALVIAAAAWIVVQSWGIVASAIHAPGGIDAAQLRDIFGLKISASLAAALVWWGVRRSRTIWAPTLLSAVLVALSIFILPVAFKQSRTLASATDITEFSDWVSAIPPTSTVLITPARDVGTFVWFTLQRPNYFAVNQSAGVVFSRTTALEVQRRSQVLLPVMDPNYRILTSLRAAAGKRKVDPPTRPLTAESLNEVCADSQLGFVISPLDVGGDPLSHKDSGSWKGWNLYDCRKVRSLAAAK
jgi:hypothetical protein